MEIYQSINDLPIQNFIKIVTKGDLSWLCKERKESKARPKFNPDHFKERAPIWRSIANECTELLEGDISAVLFHLLKELTTIRFRLKTIDDIVDFMVSNPTQDSNALELLKILKDYGFPYKYTPDTIIEDLSLTNSMALAVLLKKQDSVRDENTMMEPGEFIEEEHFNQLVSELNTVMNFKISLTDTTLLEFLACIEMYNSQFTNKFKAQQNG